MYASKSGGYQVVSYASSASPSSSYAGVVKTSWNKATCCGAFRFGSRCTDCPGGGGY